MIIDLYLVGDDDKMWETQSNMHLELENPTGSQIQPKGNFTGLSGH